MSAAKEFSNFDSTQIAVALLNQLSEVRQLRHACALIEGTMELREVLHSRNPVQRLAAHLQEG